MSKKEITSYSNNWLAYISNLMISTTSGTIVNGLSGGAIALTSTISDEFLINRGYTAKHYLTTISLWGSIILPLGQILLTFFPEYALPLYAASFFLLFAISYFGNDFLNYQERIEEVSNCLTPIVNMFDDHKILSKKELKKISTTYNSNPYEACKIVTKDIYYLTQNPLLRTIAATSLLDLVNAYINSSFIKYVGNNGTTMLALTLIAQNPAASIMELAYSGIKISTMWFGKNIVTSGINCVSSYLDERLQRIIEQKAVTEILLAPKYAPKIAKLDNASDIAANLANDLNTLFIVGNGKLYGMTSGKVNEFMALRDIMEIAPESLIITLIRGFVKQKVTDNVQHFFHRFAKQSHSLEEEKQYIIYDLGINYNNAVITGATDFIAAKYSTNREAKAIITGRKRMLEQGEKAIMNLISIIDKFLDVLYYGYKIISGEIKVEQTLLLDTWLSIVSPFLQGKSGSTDSMEEFLIMQERVAELWKALSIEDSSDLIRCSNTKNKIIFNNYLLKFDDKEVINIKDLKLEMGKCYAFCGTSGIGKTTILKDLIGCLPAHFNSSGEISLPLINGKKAVILLLDQNSYIPIKSTLLQAITLKTEKMLSLQASLKLKVKIISLLKEFSIDKWADKNEKGSLVERLDDPDFKIDTLSGGQKKKVEIIKAIIAQPDILIMDEIFNGLDSSSIAVAQELLKKYLSNTTLIIVDHHAKNNNYEGFYDACVNFTNNDCQKGILPPVPYPVNDWDFVYDEKLDDEVATSITGETIDN